jgi:tetratricopeptide (TPR) repeat protein
MAPLLACLWDTETLLQERAAAPSVLEVIVGKFPRHSRAYYEWRLEDRLTQLESDPDNDRLLDDIAVSYEKLGNHDAAIAIAKEQLNRTPRRYETLANLGTFLIHKGELEEGMSYIESAIDVNPDAHFGREEYQLLLVKYLSMLSRDGDYTLPLGANRLSEDDWKSKYPFMRFIGAEVLGDDDTWIGEVERQKAVDAILGMMRFSQHDSPVLLDVLGELLEVDSRRRLAFRCYMSAATQVADGEAKQGYETLARRVIGEQHNRGNTEQPVSAEEVLARFRKERLDADDWFAELTANEAKWIAAGEDVDARFHEHYRDPQAALIVEDANAEPTYGDEYASELVGNIVLAVVFSCLCGIGIIAMLWVAIIRRRRNAIACPGSESGNVAPG